MKLLREGTWEVSSESDPRFNMKGEGCVGGLVMPPAATRAVEQLAQKLGVTVPEDLVYSYHKY